MQDIPVSAEVAGKEAGYETKGRTIIDDHNIFNKISCLVMLCNFQHHCLTGERLVLN